jgi:hypothetical protein
VSRYNRSTHRSAPAVAFATSPIATTTTTPDTRTALGAPGYTRGPQAELFLLATGALQDGTDQHHESGQDRDARLSKLASEIAIDDPQWVVDFATWLRGPGNMRTASLMIAADFNHARLAAGNTGDGLNRRIIGAVCRRADEPGELLAYWTATYGRSVPKPVKRGIADAVRRLYNGKSLLKWDSDAKGYRFGDVLNLVHAAADPAKPWQGDVFRYALDLRHNPGTAVPPASNHTLTARKKLMDLPVAERRAVVLGNDGPERLAEAGMTWEALAGWLQGPLDKSAWESVIPSMGIMAQLRNLRNFDQAGVSDTVAKLIIERLTDPDEIAASKQFPFRFLSAYRATKENGSLRWAYPLEQALNHSLANVPSLGGRTLIMVDRSPSMFPNTYPYTPSRTDKQLGMSRADQAAIFGTALALRAQEPTLVQFGGTATEVIVRKGSSVLPMLEKFGMIAYTNIAASVQQFYRGHDRVVIITDEQTGGHATFGRRDESPFAGVDTSVPPDVPVFMWNLAGYKSAAMRSGSNARFALGGLTDQAFTLIPLLEAGAVGVWPWQLERQGS